MRPFLEYDVVISYEVSTELLMSKTTTTTIKSHKKTLRSCVYLGMYGENNMYVDFTRKSQFGKLKCSHPFSVPIVDVLGYYVLSVWMFACTPHSFGPRIDIA